MSFTSTPLGSQNNRRVDHHTFFNKHQNIDQARAIPSSFAFSGAPVTRSPPKQPNPLPPHEQDNPDEPALVRFAKQKQRATNSSLDPGRWTVKDTSVQIANAFHQAATGDTSMPPSNPNDSWASGTTRKPNLPRSTSVEYEKETQSTIRRIGPPPPANRGTLPRRPVAKNNSIQHVPDSEDEDSVPAAHVRGKSPFEHVADAARSVLKPATYFMVRRSQEPEELNGKESSSYDYAEEEQEFQQNQQQPNSLSKKSSHKRAGRMANDNKAYRPSASDLELSDEYSDDGKRTRRKKKNKKDAAGGPLTNLPVAGYDKRRKRKKNAKNGEPGGEGDDDESESETDEQEKVSEHRASASQRASVARSTQPIRLSVPRVSIPPESYEPNPDTSMDVEQGLNSIPEVDETYDPDYEEETVPSQPPAAFSIGGFLGRIVNFTIRSFVMLFSSIFRMFGHAIWTLGQLVGVAVKAPKDLFNSINFSTLASLAAVGLGVWLIWNQTQDSAFGLPTVSWSRPSRTPYHPPSVPAGDLAELSARLQALESALTSISLDNEKETVRLKNDLSRGTSDLVNRLGVLEGKLQRENVGRLEAETQFRQSTSQGISAVKQELETLQSQVASAPSKGDSDGTDAEARNRLKLLEDRFGSVEGGLKEALEIGKNSVKVGTTAGAAAWWNKLASSNSPSSLTIKSSDGQDVTGLITHLVESAASKYTKDVLARPDFALNSGGATVIPSLTSSTYEIRPVGVTNQIVGLITGSGHAVGRPPITALHPDINNGHCWPFAGTQGQLGVKLASPARISDIAIDHVAKEVAFDMRSAPRDMELWGLVEGKDNLAKFKTYLAEKQARREASIAAEEPIRPEDEEWVYPKDLPRGLNYARIATFTYDIHSSMNIQAFPAEQGLRDLEMDFGLVVLFIKNNWGREQFTCLYRLRVYGDQVVELPAPWSPPTDESS